MYAILELRRFQRYQWSQIGEVNISYVICIDYKHGCSSNRSHFTLTITLFVCVHYPQWKWWPQHKIWELDYNIEAESRVEICRDRHDRRSCKICASCVNFPRRHRNFSHNLRRTSRFTHTKCDFALKLLKFYTLS